MSAELTLRFCRQCGASAMDSATMPDRYILCTACFERGLAKVTGSKSRKPRKPRKQGDDFDWKHLPEAPKEPR